MNGVLNVIAALIVGAAIVWFGYQWSSNQDAAAITPEQLEEFKAEYVREAQENLAQNCPAGSDCEADDADFGEMEEPYASGVAVSENATPENSEAAAPMQPTDLADATEPSAVAATADQPSTENELEAATDRQAIASSESFEADTPTAVLGASMGGDDGEPAGASDDSVQLAALQDPAQPEDEDAQADEAESDEYFTENRTLRAEDGETAPAAPRVDKPDTTEYFTENRRTDGTPVDKPDSDQYFTENRRTDGTPVDKPDTDQYFTENRPMPTPVPLTDPCIREDGSVYTGPGTYKDPFADGDPCLVEQQIAETPPPPLPPEPPVVYTEVPPTWTSPYQDLGPEFPRTTLGPRGSDYPMQVAMNYDPRHP